jgi:hypothetical protein
MNVAPDITAGTAAAVVVGIADAFAGPAGS